MDNEVLFVPSFPFDESYVDQIVIQLQTNDPFVILGIDDEQKKYSIFHMSYSQEILGTRFVAHLDRNIVAYCYQFIRGDTRNLEQQKMALSALLYLNMFAAKYDLSQMVLEAHHTRSGEHTLQTEISTWNLLMDTLQSSDIQYALDLIGKGRNSLPEGFEARRTPIATNDEGVEPDIVWYSAYIHLLQMATIQRRRFRSADAVHEYLNWIIQVYKSDTATVYFSIIFFSEKRNFKEVFRDKYMIQNIAWDLAHIQHWFHDSLAHIGKSNVMDILVTNDQRLKEIAVCLSRGVRTREDSLIILEKFARTYFNEANVARLMKTFSEYESNLTKSDRKRRSFDDVESKKVFIGELERELFG
jgi:hypothetical protein